MVRGLVLTQLTLVLTCMRILPLHAFLFSAQAASLKPPHFPLVRFFALLSAHLRKFLSSAHPLFLATQAATSPQVSARPWHASGAEYWNQIKHIVPRGYTVLRTNPNKPILFDDGDIFSDCWEHAPWTEPFVDIEGPEKYGPPP